MTSPDAKYGFNDLAYGRIKDALGSSKTSFDLIKGNVYPFLPGWASTKELFSTFRGPDGSLEIIKITGISGHRLTVERGQDGTVARNWPAGALLTQRSAGADLNRIIQKGEYRTIGYNPNGILSPNYPGEKVYETGPNPCQVRWWLHSEGVKWRLIAGVKCDWEYYDQGYVKVAYLDFDGDDDDGYIQYENGNWTTCRTAPVGDLVNDDASGFLYGIRATVEYNDIVYKIRRSFLYFDLSSAPMGITQAELHLKGKGGGGDPVVSFQKGSQGKPLSTADYDAFTGPLFATLDPETNDTEYTVPLNYDGVYYLELVVALAGIAKFCLREYAHDVQGLTVPAFYNYSISIYDNDYPSSTWRPFLRLRYD